MGHRPPRYVGPPPTRESIHLGMARMQYVADRLGIDEYERSVEHVLCGGHLNQDGRISTHPLPREVPVVAYPQAIVYLEPR